MSTCLCARRRHVKRLSPVRACEDGLPRSSIAEDGQGPQPLALTLLRLQVAALPTSQCTASMVWTSLTCTPWSGCRPSACGG